MALAGTMARVLHRLCLLTHGSGMVSIDCRTDVGQPLGLSEDALWDVIDTLLADGYIVPAQKRGVRVRLTAYGARWCATLPRRRHILRRVMGKSAGDSVSVEQQRSNDERKGAAVA